MANHVEMYGKLLAGYFGSPIRLRTYACQTLYNFSGILCRKVALEIGVVNAYDNYARCVAEMTNWRCEIYAIKFSGLTHTGDLEIAQSA